MKDLKAGFDREAGEGKEDVSWRLELEDNQGHWCWREREEEEFWPSSPRAVFAEFEQWIPTTGRLTASSYWPKQSAHSVWWWHQPDDLNDHTRQPLTRRGACLILTLAGCSASWQLPATHSVSDAILKIPRRPREFRRMEVFILIIKSPGNHRLFKGSACGPFFCGGTCLTFACYIFPGHNSLEKNIAKWLHKQF